MPAKPLPATTAVATGALDIERTNRFAEKARALGVSTNTLVLSALVKASRPFVCEGYFAARQLLLLHRDSRRRG
jgi:hypothetical protein